MKDLLPFLSEIDSILMKMEVKILNYYLKYRYICTTFTLKVFSTHSRIKTKDSKVFFNYFIYADVYVNKLVCRHE